MPLRVQFRVTLKGSRQIKFPALLVRQFIVGAEVEVTSDAIQAAMLSEILMTFVDAVGGLVGHALWPVRHDVSVRCAQYAAWFDAGMRLKIARRILGAKIHNSIVVLQRFRKNHPDLDCREAVATLRGMAERLEDGGDMDTLRGMEGLAAGTYFQRFGGMLLKGFTFNGRSRQPPLDPVSAMLSFGYTPFSREPAIVAEALGLDPYLGFLHEPKPARPSLALDLVEPLRGSVVDRFVLGLTKPVQIQPHHFSNIPEPKLAIYLNREGGQRVVKTSQMWATQTQPL